MIIVQIGTNNGNDHVLDFCKKNLPSHIYLVEPFHHHNEIILKNYEFTSISLDNVAITPTKQDSVDLYYTEDDGPKNDIRKSYQVASILPEHILKHNYSANTLSSIRVSAMTLNDYFLSKGLLHIDYLFLDIEGIDMEVLESIDFNKFDIRHLQIEHLHLDIHKLHVFMQTHGYVATRGIDFHGFDTMFYKI